MSPSIGDAVLCINSVVARRESAPGDGKYAKNGIAQDCQIPQPFRRGEACRLRQ